LEDGDELRVGGFSFRPILGPPRDLVPRPPEAGSLQLATPPAAGAMAPFSNEHAGGELASVVSLFSAMQVQMAEQFRLTMTGMFDTFRRMQSDQMRLVWDELAQIRRLTDEVTSLKATLTRLPAGAARPAEPPRQPAVPPERT